MSQLVTFNGTTPGDGTGDPDPIAFQTLMTDVAELYAGTDLLALPVAASIAGTDLVDVLQLAGSTTFTGSVGGALGGTLSAPFGPGQGTYAAVFESGETRTVKIASDGVSVSWAPTNTAMNALLALHAGSNVAVSFYTRRRTTAAAIVQGLGGSLITYAPAAGLTNNPAPAGWAATVSRVDLNLATAAANVSFGGWPTGYDGQEVVFSNLPANAPYTATFLVANGGAGGTQFQGLGLELVLPPGTSFKACYYASGLTGWRILS